MTYSILYAAIKIVYFSADEPCTVFPKLRVVAFLEKAKIYDKNQLFFESLVFAKQKQSIYKSVLSNCFGSITKC